jgi:hypothetical protein
MIGFEHKDDARRFLDAMRDRLGEFALSLAAEFGGFDLRAHAGAR